MGILTDIAGSIIGIGVLILVVIIISHLDGGLGNKLFKGAHPWVHRGLTVLSYGAACLIAVTGLGALWQSIINWALGFLPAGGAAISAEIITISSFFLILGLIAGFITEPGSAIVMYAAMVPFALILTSHGFVNDFWTWTSGPTMHAATAFNQWVGG
jgi:hypothetical protein